MARKPAYRSRLLKPAPLCLRSANADRQLNRLKTDRERLGGVNLQADDDLVELSAQLESMQNERNDVDQSIAKLRGAIGQLNKEGKARLDEAFKTVNGHFELFTHLFVKRASK